MNKLSITLICILALTFIGSGLIYLRMSEQLISSQAIVSSLTSKVSGLNDTIANITNENIGLMRTSNLRAFETPKALQRFLNEANAPLNIKSTTYPSETCIDLMKEAKLKGYWLGITVINTSNEPFWTAYVRDYKGNADIKWHTFAVAIVGDSDIYLIEPQTVNDTYFIVSLTGDFAQYNSESKSSATNLKLH